MKYQIIMPAALPDRRERCLASIDESIRPNVRVIDNSIDNIGITAAWNIGAMAVIDEALDFLVILSAGVTFDCGMVDFISELEQLPDSELGLDSQYAWHCLALRREVLQEIGVFDSQFFAYYEDSDYVRRLWLRYGKLIGVLNPGVARVPRVRRFGVSATLEVSHALNAGVSGINVDESRATFIGKWGGEPSYESVDDLNKLWKAPYDPGASSLL